MWTLESEVVGELCAQRPLAIDVLRRHGIDAADTTRSLAACCRDLAIDVATVLAELAHREDQLTGCWHDRALPELIDHILRVYHRPFAATFTEAADAIDAARPPSSEPAHAAWAELARQLAELRADLEQHMDKEERVLFPWLRSRAETAAAPVRAMQLEHTDTVAQLHALRASLRRCIPSGPLGPLEEAVARKLELIERRLCEHIHLEANELFRRALDLGLEPPRR